MKWRLTETFIFHLIINIVNFYSACASHTVCPKWSFKWWKTKFTGSYDDCWSLCHSRGKYILLYFENSLLAFLLCLAWKSNNNTSILIFLPSISQKVTLFFHGKLYRGNRALKVDARRFGAFDSPNCPPLATVEAGIEGMIKRVYLSEMQCQKFLSRWIHYQAGYILLRIKKI